MARQSPQNPLESPFTHLLHRTVELLRPSTRSPEPSEDQLELVEIIVKKSHPHIGLLKPERDQLMYGGTWRISWVTYCEGLNLQISSEYMLSPLPVGWWISQSALGWSSMCSVKFHHVIRGTWLLWLWVWLWRGGNTWSRMTKRVNSTKVDILHGEVDKWPPDGFSGI